MTIAIEFGLTALGSKFFKKLEVVLIVAICSGPIARALLPTESSPPPILGLEITDTSRPLAYTYLDAARSDFLGTAQIKVVDAKPVQEVIAPTPVTHLTLLGTVTDATPNLASAFIGVSGQSSKRVFVGKNISDEIKLVAVERDYVTIERSEKLELLYFPNGNPKTIITPPNKRQIQKMDQNSAEQRERSDLFNPGMEALEQLRKSLRTE